MLICFASDLHGSTTLYDQLEALLRAERPDLLILGGDLMIDGSVDDPVASQVAYVQRDFMQHVDAWRAQSDRLEIACLPGNHEWGPTREALQSEAANGRLVLLSHEQAWEHGGVRFLGYACTPPTPHNVKDFERRDLPDDPPTEFQGVVWDPKRQETRDAELTEHFERLPSMDEELSPIQAPAAPWIFVSHAPPYESTLDRLPNVAYPIGSRAIRRFIAARQPMVALHGHVHESAQVTGSYTDLLGATLCINPGQGREQLHAVLFEAERPADTLRHTVLT